MEVKTFEELFRHKLTIRELIEGFNEDTLTGEVVGFGGKLNIRPKYQREFVYGDDKKIAVIDTVLKGYPLSVMYWAKVDDGTYELMDGQQRTLSICKFAENQYSVKVPIGNKIAIKTFDTLGSKQDDFLDYTLDVYICDGSKDDKLAWFQIINIAGVKLTEQEMRNAIYHGYWVDSAKYYFSHPKCTGICSDGKISNGHSYGDYFNLITESSEKENSVSRQKLLEIVLSWAVDAYNREQDTKITIDEYMSMHCEEPDAAALWKYYEDVMEWVKAAFPTYRAYMKSVQWGILYNKYHATTPKDADIIANNIFTQLSDEITNHAGVYEAVLSQDIKFIHARDFSKKDKSWAYKKQGGICPYCHQHFDEDQMHGDHIKPWSKGGATERENLQMLCIECNLKKSAYDTKFNPWDGTEYAEFDIETWNASQSVNS